ncbi:histidine phosphatase family protein [Rhizobium sullae]|uniref:Histidine phosphatase family protein n=1 Tax=Rhizobium sullae TaxID=50338 RepID=A0A2N0D3T1_RHISU|nr:histidine phosphatase family protein [Rhizobium sullae]PKA40774.1 histidine phosphatase family protein [Rhizobium sullae]UWU13807.1 histidine phosphatase family protein [Rhizobium sullae]
MNAPNKPSPKYLRLFLLRHAKSAWPADIADHDRPLAKRGRKAAPLIGAYMAREKLFPDLVLVSTAQRAQGTWKRVAKKLSASIAERDVPDLYEAPAGRIAGILQKIESSARTVMLVGHNPGFQDLANNLIGNGDPDACARLKDKFPTAGLAIIAFEANRWADISPGSGRLERFVTPRELR